MTRGLVIPMLRSIRRVQVLSQHLRMNSTAASDDAVLMERRNNCGIITLNRPRVLNTLNLPMVRTMYPQVKEWDNDADMKMVIIKGTGEKAFCAGGDIVAVVKANLAKEKELGERFFKEEYVLNHLIGTLHIPWIALIDGITMGGGVGLSVHGQFRVATERTLFAMPETAIGLFPDVGGGYFLPRLKGKMGMYLALTGFRLKGRDVLHAGIATHFVESSKLPELEESLVNLSNTSSDGISKLLGEFQRASTTDADKPFILKPHVDAIDRIFNGNTVEEILAKLEQEDSEWSNKQLELLHKMSPTSLKVTLRQILNGETMSLAEDLAMEYRLTQRCCADNDLQEGVRAVIIDKDHKPVWNPAKLSAVTDAKVDWYFSDLPEEHELKL